jgi:ferredoxin
MRRAIVVGSGAGGAAVARELQGKFQVTVLEAGNSFHPFTGSLNMIGKVKKIGLFFNERQIHWIFPTMNIGQTGDGMILVNGIGQGGTTTISAGNAIRQDNDLKAIGINLDAEFQELAHEIPIYTDHQKYWHTPTREAYKVCQDLGLQPQSTPKMIRRERCIGCGKCVLGCSQGAKWDSRDYLNQAIENGAVLVSGCRVQKIIIEQGRAIGIVAANNNHAQLYHADLIILAAGGLGTPVIMQQSGIKCQANLFVDPVLCVATRWEKALQNREIPMPFIVQKDHFMISPYFDFLSFFFNRRWRYPAGDIFSLMIKLADTNSGSICNHRVKKTLSDTDTERLKQGVEICTQVFRRMGKKDCELFTGTINAGHPGGMLPLTEKESRTLHHEFLPANLYVADASLFPNSLGNPPILTIVAMAKRISKLCLEYA